MTDFFYFLGKISTICWKYSIKTSSPCFNVPKIWNFTSGEVQNHETEKRRLNDCDVISGHLLLRKTDFSVNFLLWAKKLHQKMVQTCVAYKKIRKWLRNMFSAKVNVLKWRFGFVRHWKWNFTFLVHQNTGKKHHYWTVFAILIIEHIKKICHIHFKLKF